MTLGYNKPLYILPFDHRATFKTGMFGWQGSLSPEQTAQIAATKAVIYDGLKAAVAAGVPKDRAAVSAVGRRLQEGACVLSPEGMTKHGSAATAHA